MRWFTAMARKLTLSSSNRRVLTVMRSVVGRVAYTVDNPNDTDEVYFRCVPVNGEKIGNDGRSGDGYYEIHVQLNRSVETWALCEIVGC